MKQIRYGERTWMAGDAIADLLIQYAAALARSNSAESVRISVIDAAGEHMDIDLLLGPASMMSSEPTMTDMAEPDNDQLELAIRQRAAALEQGQ